jgi:hypothetical protein
MCAVGYSYDAVKIFCDKNGNVTMVPYQQHVPHRRDHVHLLAEEPRPGSLARRSSSMPLVRSPPMRALGFGALHSGLGALLISLRSFSARAA